MYGTPSLKPAQGFNASSDAEVLRKAMKGFGCDKNKIVMILCARTNWQVWNYYRRKRESHMF